MTELLVIVAIFTTVFGIDYLRYQKNPLTYQYVSWETYALLILGQVAVIAYDYTYFQPFFEHATTEIVAILILLALILLFSFALKRERLLVCHTSSRTERCLTPGYVMVKGAELVFQQLTYAAIAFSLASQLGVSLYTFIAYTLILLIIHTPLIISMNKSATMRLSFGIFALSAPLFYSFVFLELFSPAIYLHSLLYIFLWLTFADWEGSTGNSNNSAKSGKLR